MAIAITNGNVSLSAPANAFYKAECYYSNATLGQPSGTMVNGASPTAVMTPTTNHNNCGVVVGLYTGAAVTSVDYDVTAQLQTVIGTITIAYATPIVLTFPVAAPADGTIIQLTSSTHNMGSALSEAVRYYVVNSSGANCNVSLTLGGAAIGGGSGGTGTFRAFWDVTVANGFASNANQTLTAAQIANNLSDKRGNWGVLFSWTAFPVTNVANTWQISFYQSNGTTGYWSIPSYTGTYQVEYFEYTDIAYTAVSGADLIIVKPGDKLTADVNWTFPILTNRSLMLCKNTSAPNSGNSVRSFECYTNSVTLTFQADIMVSAHSAIQFGTAASPITGLSLAGGPYEIKDWNRNNGGTGNIKSSYWWYGATPTVTSCRLNADVTTLSTSFTTPDDITSVPVGTKFYIGGSLNKTTADSTQFTVSSIVDNGDGTYTCNFTGTPTDTHKAFPAPASGIPSGTVIFWTGAGWGITNSLIIGGAPANCVMQGVITVFTGNYAIYSFISNASLSAYYDTTSDSSTISISYCAFSSTSVGSKFTVLASGKGITIDNCNMYLINNYSVGYGGGVLTFTNNKCIVSSRPPLLINSVVTDNTFEGQTTLTNTVTIGDGCTHERNNYWGRGQGATHTGLYNPLSNDSNQYNNCSIGVMIGTGSFYRETNAYIGNLLANTTDISASAATYFNAGIIYDTPRTSIALPASIQPYMLGTFVILNNNNTPNLDTLYCKMATIDRTGFGLTDTTVWTGSAFGAASAGQFGWKVSLLSGTDVWDSIKFWDKFVKTTGDITGKNVTVTARVKISNAAFYAGTYTARMKITDNDGTIHYENIAASTADQQIAHTFMPTTSGGSYSYGFELASDAGANAVIYLGEIDPGVPEGTSVSNKRYEYHVDGIPNAADSTVPTNNSIWSEPSTTDSGGASMKQVINDILAIVLTK